MRLRRVAATSVGSAPAFPSSLRRASSIQAASISALTVKLNAATWRGAQAQQVEHLAPLARALVVPLQAQGVAPRAGALEPAQAQVGQ